MDEQTNKHPGKGYYLLPDGTAQFVRKLWADCNKKDPLLANELAMMGYSMRTLSYRYTMWIPFGKELARPNFTLAQNFFQEELYNHQDEKPSDFTHREIVNVAMHPEYLKIKHELKDRLTKKIREDFIFLGPVVKMRPTIGYMRNDTLLPKNWYGGMQPRFQRHDKRERGGPSSERNANAPDPDTFKVPFSTQVKQNLARRKERQKKVRENLQKEKEEKERASALA